jgi:hypothetical protein
VVFGDNILVLGGVRLVTQSERKEDEKEREREKEKERSTKDSATSESDFGERLPFQVKRIELADFEVLQVGTFV